MAKNAIGAALIPAIMDVVGKAVIRASNDPMVPGVASASPSTVAAVQEKAAVEIAKSPELQHVTNQEPWYKKRSRWSSIIGPIFGMLVPIATVYGVNLPPETQEVVVLGATFFGSAWAAWLAFRAGTATKPLFSE